MNKFIIGYSRYLLLLEKLVFYDWLPAFLDMTEEEISESVYTGYKSYVHPGVTHEFQSATMRWGHTLVPPGVYRRNDSCEFRKTTNMSSDLAEIGKNGAGFHGVRTCNAFWNPQIPVEESGIEEFLMGMALQITEREDNIITQDLQRRVFGPLDFSRRDVMVLNIQRARDHGLPDYNTARVSLGLERKNNFLEINPYYNDTEMSDIDEEVLNNLRDVYNNDIDKVDIWAGGLLETTARGPGELFRSIILDQFVRVRDGDRFWFENERNGLFTKEQIDYIHNITVWDVIVNCTDVPPGALQRDPFHFNEGDLCWNETQDPIIGHGNPDRTVSESDLDNCTDLEGYDYFSGSEVSFALTFLAAGVWSVGCVVMLFVLAHKRSKYTAEKHKELHKKSRRGKPDRLKTYNAIEWCGNKEAKRPVQIMLGPGKQIKVQNEKGDKNLRTIDLKLVAKLILQVAPDRDQRYLVVKLDREYDLVLKFDDQELRTEFINDFESWLGSPEVGVGREKHEVKESQLLKDAVTKGQRQKMLEKFFRVAFLRAYQDLDFDPDDVQELEKSIAKDVLSCELTRTEFAEILSMNPNSKFVINMFELVDKDQSGMISFREFMDIIVIFAKGKPEDKLRLFFNMYDIDKSGQLSKDEFKTMLRYKRTSKIETSTPQNLTLLSRAVGDILSGGP